MNEPKLDAIRERAKKQRSAKKAPSSTGSTACSSAAVIIENLPEVHRLRPAEDKPTNTASGSNEEEDDENSDRTEMGCYAEELVNTRSARFMLAAVVEETGL
ncbi:unnamed protein product [Plutella xylostella]|uniref:(diamondback moth) hypothetical protein n=1 Tax=Plutella xylostella TaxID=51655 RepID=A0A8S4G326_PLUXY|nr:unnamed protein product [Plutella xylostella]